MNNRAGVFNRQAYGYRSFVPKKLPPEPPIVYDDELFALLSLADRKLGRLDGITEIIPNPDFFVEMYVTKEALLSAQIEGTQASLIDVIDIDDVADKGLDVGEVVNYVGAMNHGLSRLSALPLSLRLIREIHAVLLKSGRGSARTPGEFRTSQNWIGPKGCTLDTATFIPPTVPDMLTSLYDLENYMHDQSHIPALIKIALIHAQFETIHPFLDGNGRMGRLLITFWLCQQKILSKPLLYLSFFFKQNKQDYYDRLTAIREKGDWENWLKFFLRGISIVSDESIASAKAILRLKERLSALVGAEGANNLNYQRLLDALFDHPIISINLTKELLSVSHPTATRIVRAFDEYGIIEDITPKRERDKKYIFREYYNILEQGTELIGAKRAP